MSFDRLKATLCAISVLRLPDFRRPFIVDADTSDQVVGAVLLQYYKDKQHPVADFSKKHSLMERNYRKVMHYRDLYINTKYFYIT